jgi:hypothetical protein
LNTHHPIRSHWSLKMKERKTHRFHDPLSSEHLFSQASRATGFWTLRRRFSHVDHAVFRLNTRARQFWTKPADRRLGSRRRTVVGACEGEVTVAWARVNEEQSRPKACICIASIRGSRGSEYGRGSLAFNTTRTTQ